MIRKTLYLILALALLSVPIFLMAHAFTHYAQVDVLNIDTESDDADLDEICFECLALTGLTIILISSELFLSDLAAYLRLSWLATQHYSINESFSYHSRAPPFTSSNFLSY